MKKDDFGVWEIVLPAVNGEAAIPHNSKLKAGHIPRSYQATCTNSTTDLHDQA